MATVVADPDLTLYVGDAVELVAGMADQSVDAVVTSPPYLDARLEYPSPSPDEFRRLFVELARVVRGGMVWNVGRLWRGSVERLWWVELVELAAEAGWSLLDTLVWVKPNGNPIRGQLVADSHEYVLALGRSVDVFYPDELRTEYAPGSLERYGRQFAANAGVKGYDRPAHRRPLAGAAHELGARGRSFVVAYTGGEKGNPHPAPMPTELADLLVAFVSRPGELVLDPFAGSGTTAVAARRQSRRAVLVERDAEYAEQAAWRLQQLSLFAEAPAPGGATIAG